VVIESGWATPTKVQFTVKGWLADKKVTITVGDDEIR